MTDPVPSKDLLADLDDVRKECLNHDLNGCADDVQRAIDEVANLRREDRRWENAHKILIAENDRLRKQVEELSIHAEKWVKRALGTYNCIGNCGASVPGPNAYCEACFLKERRGARALAESAYKDGYGADLTDDRDLSERTHELMHRLSRPAHEREMPHCSSCSCPPYEASQPFEHPYAQHPHHVCTCGAKVPSDVYVLHTCGDRLTPKGSAPEPAADRSFERVAIRDDETWPFSPIWKIGGVQFVEFDVAIEAIRKAERAAQPPGDG